VVCPDAARPAGTTKRTQHRRSRLPCTQGGLRDPSNTQADLRDALAWCGLAWVTSHVFRKTTATLLDNAGLSARAIADQLGHAQPSLTQNVYMGRKIASPEAAHALEQFN
jgi:integrase